MPATDKIEEYTTLARQLRLYANLTERFGNRTQAEQLRDEAALYERTAVWMQQNNEAKLES